MRQTGRGAASTGEVRLVLMTLGVAATLAAGGYLGFDVLSSLVLEWTIGGSGAVSIMRWQTIALVACVLFRDFLVVFGRPFGK